MSPSMLEQQMFAMCVAALPSIYGDVLAADPAQMKNMLSVKNICNTIKRYSVL